MTKEDKIIDLVRKWVDSNPAEFGESETNQILYRKVVFERCRKYVDAPDEYLNLRQKTLPEERKWYFNIFQTVFIAGMFGLETSLLILSLSHFSAWFQEVPLDFTILKWLLPFILFLVLAGLSFKEDKRHKTSWLSAFIQTKSRILHNLKEIDIETYCVSKIIEARKEKEKENSS